MTHKMSGFPAYKSFQTQYRSGFSTMLHSDLVLDNCNYNAFFQVLFSDASYLCKLLYPYPVHTISGSYYIMQHDDALCIFFLQALLQSSYFLIAFNTWEEKTTNATSIIFNLLI